MTKILYNSEQARVAPQYIRDGEERVHCHRRYKKEAKIEQRPKKLNKLGGIDRHLVLKIVRRWDKRIR